MAIDTVPSKLLDPLVASALQPADVGTAAAEDVAAGGTGDLARVDNPAITAAATVGLADGDARGIPRHLGNWTPTGGSAPVALWQMTQANVAAMAASSTDIPDLIGSLDLALTGTALHGYLSNGLSGFHIDGGTTLKTSIAPALQITGAVTVHFQAEVRKEPPTNGIFFGVYESGESLVTNGLIDLRTASPDQLRVTLEYGAAGTDSVYSPPVDAELTAALWSLTRASDGVNYTLYRDGLLVASWTQGHAAEKAGSGNIQYLQLGLNGLEYTIAALGFWAEEHSDAQVLEIATAAWGGATP